VTEMIGTQTSNYKLYYLLTDVTKISRESAMDGVVCHQCNYEGYVLRHSQCSAKGLY